MPIFREHELSYMLEFAGTKLLIVPKLFRGFDHEAMTRSLQPKLSKLQHVVVVDGEGASSFDQHSCPVTNVSIRRLRRNWRAPHGPDGSADVHVRHHRIAQRRHALSQFADGLQHWTWREVSPRCERYDAGVLAVGSHDGFAAGMLLGLKIGATVVFQDVWEPKRGVAIMANEGVTYSAGAATFLADMCEAVASGSPKPGRLRNFLCAGAPIPPALIDRVYRELDLKVCSLWA